MQRRPIVVAGVVVAAGAAAVAFTLPSLAGTNEAASPAAAKKSPGGVSPNLLAAMKRDLGLDGEQAAARLARSEWAGGVSATLAARTGEDFGGAWLASDGTTLKVAVTDSAAASAVKAAGAVPVLVKHSEAELDAAKTKLDAAGVKVAGLTGWYVDVTTNKLVVVAKSSGKAEALALAKRAGVPADAVAVKVSDAQPKPLFDLRGADPYFINVGGGQARCSIGFSVQGGFVTAGHCGAEGATTTGFNNEAQGTVEFSVFPGAADMGFVAVNGDWTPRAVVNDFEGNELPVAGNTEAPVGAAVCRSGSTTGTFCGTILAKNQTVVYPEGAVTGLTRTDVCAEGGDSGGPWLSGDQAQGLTSGGSGDCTVGGETFFQPLNEVLAAQDLTLVTTGGTGGGESTTPPAETACEALPVQRTGAINRAGQAQAQPNGGSYRARAGTHTACLDAPAGTDFDLLLQEQNQQGGFRTVAEATGSGDKSLTFTGGSGTYRYVVVASSGTGSYSLGFDVQ
ncbi:S1 family peptidase [Actinoplanes sp. NEAU-A12]|uniref:S1 family peptidase n=1 Tax=Actinoplanes sandaracinus TaxID=3045177 RepID=A0ABT6WCW7_9ACTN|nr:S1 family peptidase [Actinoplanes sandaracinus]MDI6097554.1 S1 family peptidase [Actinoplanes sandaracinus]